MANTIRLTGVMPENWEKALCELSEDLGFTVAETGIPVVAQKGEEPAVFCDGETVTITWAEPVQFFRGLSQIPQPLAKCDIREKVGFKSSGVMFDCSRNAVLTPDSLRFFLRKMALMGLNLAMILTKSPSSPISATSVAVIPMTN